MKPKQHSTHLNYKETDCTFNLFFMFHARYSQRIDPSEMIVLIPFFMLAYGSSPNLKSGIIHPWKQ